MCRVKQISPAHHLEVDVGAFLKIVRTLAWDVDAANVHADIRHKLTSTSQPIGNMDMLIAAHAVTVGAVLATEMDMVEHITNICVQDLRIP